MLEFSPGHIGTLNGIATSQRGKLDIAHVKTLEKRLENKNTRAGALSSLHNALAYFYDNKKQVDIAAMHMKKANQYQW